jgi:tyrosyl-tRNA synthetase
LKIVGNIFSNLRLFTLLRITTSNKPSSSLASGAIKNVEPVNVVFETSTKMQSRSIFLPSSSIPRGSVRACEKSIPSIELPLSVIERRPKVTEIFGDYKLTGSRGEARRLIQQGGVYVNNQRVADIDTVLSTNDILDGKVAVRIGKKKHFHILVK